MSRHPWQYETDEKVVLKISGCISVHAATPHKGQHNYTSAELWEPHEGREGGPASKFAEVKIQRKLGGVGDGCRERLP